MWFFLEFLPQIFSLLKRVKDNFDNTEVITLTFLYFLILVLVTIYSTSFVSYIMYALITLIYGIWLTVILDKKTDTNLYVGNYDLNEILLIQDLKYKELRDKVICVPQASQLEFKVVFSLQPLYIELNSKKILSEKLNFLSTLKKIVFLRNIYDSKKDKYYLIKVSIKGFFIPKIEIEVKLLGSQYA